MIADIAGLRKALQEPRRPYDTLYGKYVMRRLSIYITALLAHSPFQPVHVTFLSILSGVYGAGRLAMGDWLQGIIFVNAWYLLDHVDGELARFKKVSSMGGLFFDTMANFIVPPLAMVAIGNALNGLDPARGWLWMGLASGYGLVMMLALPFCESMVVLQTLQLQSKMGLLSKISKKPEALEGAVGSRDSFFKKVFSWIHLWITFPVALPLLTLLIFGFSFLGENSVRNSLKIFVASYAMAVTLVWVIIFVHMVVTDKMGRKYE